MEGIFLDIETTGLDPRQHCPIDLALKVVDLATGETLGSYQSVLRQPQEVWDEADPSSIEVNGYRWDQIERGKDPVLVGNEVVQLFQLLIFPGAVACSSAKTRDLTAPFFLRLFPHIPRRDFCGPIIGSISLRCFGQNRFLR